MASSPGIAPRHSSETERDTSAPPSHGGSRDPANELSSKVYENAGNRSLLDLLPAEARTVLDGAGDNARLLHSKGLQVSAITLSARERDLAAPHCLRVVVCDVEKEGNPFPERSFDAMIFSHVLEHLISPRAVLTRLAPCLRPGGWVLAAVPNMAFWRVRARILVGNWEREESGFMDRTHVHFWSYRTAPEVFADTPFVLRRLVAGDLSMPLRPLRSVAPAVARALDEVIGGIFPNFAASQVLMLGQLAEGRT
jgi:SAM-dependent methyltransferase